MRKLAMGMIVFTLILTSFHAPHAEAATRYVDAAIGDDEGGANECDDSTKPCKTIMNAIEWAEIGETIEVAKGYYNESLSIGKSLSLRGAGADVTTIGSGTTKIDVTGSETLTIEVNISGFTVKLGTLYGIDFAYASGTIENNIIQDHDLDGIRLNACVEVRIIGNLISHNGWMNGMRGGAGIYISESNPVIQNNVIVDNYDYGIFISSGSPIITNNTIARNGHIEATLVDQNVLRNGFSGAGISISEGSGPSITNNIIAFNMGHGIFRNEDVGGGITYNDVYGNHSGNYGGALSDQTGINGNISANPGFSGTDYHLSCASPAVDSGTNTPPGGLPATDKDGNPRIINGTVDMGAYETRCVQKPRIIPSILPTTQTHIIQVQDTTIQADNLLTQAKSRNLDTTTCEELMNEAKELLKKAQDSLKNPIYANNLALQAMEKMRQAIDCLKALLGQ